MANAPTVVHCQENMQDSPGYTYIGRPSRWGNPFVIGTHGDRASALAQYEEYLRHQPELLAALPQLTGQQLGCWCQPEPCHGDILVKLWWEQQGQESMAGLVKVP